VGGCCAADGAAACHSCTSRPSKIRNSLWMRTRSRDTNQLMAIFDWDTPGQAKVYTDAADRKRMAGEATPMLARTK